MTDVESKQTIIPALTLKSGVFKYKQKKSSSSKLQITETSLDENECVIMYEEDTSKLYFKTINQKHFLKTGERISTTLECVDISAADLKVSTKFGCWDLITCRLLVECSQPIVAWEVRKLSDTQELVDCKAQRENSDTVDADKSVLIRKVQESCMVKVTIDIQHLPRIRDCLSSLKMSKLRERTRMQENHKKGLDRNVPLPTKVREGLPEWVNYIPAKWYSSSIRKVLEYMLMIYTLLTLTWAIWQLYKHVGFIRNVLRPILDVVELYLTILRNWFRWFDQFFILITDYWWMYMKPVYLLAAPLYTALAQLFKPLRNVADVITAVTQPIITSCRMLLTTLRPLFQPFVSFYHLLMQIGRKFFDACAFLWDMISRTTVIRLVIDRLQDMGVNRFFNELSNGSLDPFKVQMVLIRDLLIRSTKQIYSGLKFIIVRIYYMRLFMRREQEYAHVDESAESAKKDD